MCPLCVYNHGNEVKQMAYITSGAVCPGEKRREMICVIQFSETPRTHTHTLAGAFTLNYLHCCLFLWSMERFTPSRDALCIYNTDSWFHSFKKSPKAIKVTHNFPFFSFFFFGLLLLLPFAFSAGYNTSGLGLYWTV